MAGFGPVAVLPVASLPVASSTAAPFNPAENSAPIAAIVRRLDQQQRALTQTGGGAKPIGQSEQPFQVLGIVRRQDFTAAHNLVLGSDRFPPGQSGVGPEYDWTNPRLAVRFTPEGSASSPRVLLPIPAVSAPFNLTDQPNPTLGTVRRSDHTLGALTLLGGGAQPFNQSDQPLPVLGIVRRQDHALAALTFTGGGQQPFGQTDQPNPTLATVRRQDFTQGVLTFTGGGSQPFSQVDWPNPVLSQPRRFDAVNAGLVLYAVIVPPTPFALYDQPNPRGPALRPPDLWNVSHPLKFPFVQPPFAQIDHPNPVRALRTEPLSVISNQFPSYLSASFPWTPGTIPPATWSPVSAASATWTPLTPASSPWSPVTPGSSPWTPTIPGSTTWTKT